MTRVIVDAALRTKLHDFHEPLELCDEAGRVLARVVPVANVLEYEPLEREVSDEDYCGNRRELGLEAKPIDYGTSEFTRSLTEHFHRAKRRALGAE